MAGVICAAEPIAHAPQEVRRAGLSADLNPGNLPASPAPTAPPATPPTPTRPGASATSLIRAAKEDHFLPAADKILIKTEEQGDSPSVDVF